MLKKICAICKKEFEGYPNSAKPIADGVCCDTCNYETVVPMRWKLLQGVEVKLSSPEYRAQRYIDELGDILTELQDALEKKKVNVVDLLTALKKAYCALEKIDIEGENE